MDSKQAVASIDEDEVIEHHYERILIRNLARDQFNMTAQFQMLFGPPPYLTLHQFLGFRENERIRADLVSILDFVNPADDPTPIIVTFIQRGNGNFREMLIPAFPSNDILQPVPIMATTDESVSSSDTEEDDDLSREPMRVHRYGILTIENHPVTGNIPTINEILGVPENEGVYGDTMNIILASPDQPHRPIRITHIPPPNGIILDENEVLYQIPESILAQQEGIRTSQKRPPSASSDANENEATDENAPPAKIARIDSGESETMSTTAQNSQRIPDSTSSVAQTPEENGEESETVVEAPKNPGSEETQGNNSKGDDGDKNATN